MHGVGGFIGIVLCGIFATTAFNPAGVDGLLRGNSHFFLVECAAVLLGDDDTPLPNISVVTMKSMACSPTEIFASTPGAAGCNVVPAAMS